MRLFAGTSGFSYKEWCGIFYPQKIKPAEMLGFYSQKLSAVEINASFYRMPSPEQLSSWAKQVTPEFIFVLKASRRITHIQRLKDCKDLVEHLWSAATELESHRGPFLFQLPPNLKVDIARLETFVKELPAGMRATFEFRHPSWAEPKVEDCLRAANHALCAADTMEAPATIVPTAEWGYLRLRRDDYGEKELGAWVDKIIAQKWNQVFVFFKHEESPDAPNIALRFAEAWRARAS
jgi:uncharacterized protein YecE (DUF72 family)